MKQDMISRRPPLLIVMAVAILSAALSACGDTGTGPNFSTPASLIVTPGEVQLESLADPVTFTARVLDWQGKEILGVPLVWTADDGSVVASDAGGVFRSLANGRTLVRAKVDPSYPGLAGRRPGQVTVEGAATVLVEQKPVAMTLVPSLTKLSALGQQAQMTARLVDANGYPITREIVPTWTSETPLVAAVDAGGVVTARADGSARITSYLERLTASVVLRVSASMMYSACLEVGEGDRQASECVTKKIVVMEDPPL